MGEHRRVPWYHLHRRLYDWTLAWAYRPSAAVALFLLSFAESSFFPVPPDVLLMPLTLGKPQRWFFYAALCTVASVSGAVAGFGIGWLLWPAPVAWLLGFIFTVLLFPVMMMLLRRLRGLAFGALSLALALAGGSLLGWLIGLTYPGTVEQFCFEFIPGFTREFFAYVSAGYEKNNFLIVFTAGFTPIPFKVFTITAGISSTSAGVASPGAFFAIFILAGVIGRGARFFLVAGLMRLFGPRITPFIDKYFNWLALAFTALLIGGFVVIKYVI